MRSFNFATRTERQGQMKQSEIVQALRALAAKIEQAGQQHAPSPEAPRAPVASAANGVAGKVAFWDVKVRDNGKPMASLKLATGERFVCFDEKVIAAADPLIKGDNVVVALKPWTKKDGETTMLISGITKGGKGAIEADDIPF